MGGIERGIERTGVDVRVACYVEIEAFICENLVQQMEKGLLAPAPIFTDLKKFDGRPFHQRIHGITGGYPCQPFSVAGKQAGKDDPRHLWPYIKDIIGAVRPVWCFFENVPGHINLGYREVRSDLEQLGYAVEEGVFSAEEVGAPHQRKRLFILAIRTELANPSKQGLPISGQRGLGQLQTQEGEGIHDRSQQSGASELANPQHHGLPTSEISRSPQETIRQEPSGKDNTIHTQRADTSRELADTESVRSERFNRINRGYFTEKDETFKRSRSYGEYSKDKWPARPGQPQHDWEPPRVESSLGYVAHGYNFREDLLRMAGNAVVEQTAELAFRTLINKIKKP
jgi:DNA (cytosine-5)-methyltransferase 1